MEADLYDEFGNYIGPELESDEESEDDDEAEDEEVVEYVSRAVVCIINARKTEFCMTL